MKLLLTILLVALGTACSHIQTMGRDSRDNTVVIQGGKWDSQYDVRQAAMEECGGSAHLVASNVVANGPIVTFANGLSKQKTNTLYTYKCGK